MDSTVWDQIYKDHLKGAKPYATLSRGLNSDFVEFVKKTKFPVKKAFDIGFGTGHYLAWLKSEGFEVAGIDSSKTAYEMASKELGKGTVVLGDAYSYKIPKNTYGLILSVHAIHHGLKAQVEGALNEVYEGLVKGGWVYITLPLHDQHKQWPTHKNSKLIAPGTFAPTTGPEKGLPHSFYTEGEVKQLFSKYRSLRCEAKDWRGWKIIAQK